MAVKISIATKNEVQITKGITNKTIRIWIVFKPTIMKEVDNPYRLKQIFGTVTDVLQVVIVVKIESLDKYDSYYDVDNNYNDNWID